MTGELNHGSLADRRGRSSVIGSVIGSAVGALRSGAGYLVDLLSRFVSGIALLSPLVAGCEGESNAKVAAPPASIVEVAPVAEAPKDPGPIGEFDITFYYVTTEDEIAAKIAKDEAKAADAAAAAATDGGLESTEMAAINFEPPPREIVPLYETKTCAVLAEVDREFARSLALQGTGKLKDGRLLNVANQADCSCDRKPCFHIVENQHWGTAGTGRALQPFRTVAVDPKLIKLGSLLYVPLLEGRTMPGRAPWGGFIHDGCVVADDTGGGIKGLQIDLFVGRKGWYLGLSGKSGSHSWARHVPVFQGDKMCERKGRRIGRKSGAI